MHLIHRAGLALLTATLALATACSDNVTPPPPPPPPAEFDAVQARAQVQPLAAVLDQPIVRAFTGALSYYSAILRSTSGTGAMSTAPAASSPLALSRSATSAAPLELSRSATSLAPLAVLGGISIPAAYAGKTFAFDPVANYYVVDANATGAPANGVRFVLYVFDETGYPDEPLTRLGYLDITPAANGADGVHLVVTRDAPQSTVADVERTRTLVTDGSGFALTGWATDGTTRIDVAVDQSSTGTVGGMLFVNHSRLSSTSLGVVVDVQLRNDQAAQSSTGKYTVSYQGHEFTDETTTNGVELRFDGRLYANVIRPTQAGGSSTYLKADGTSLTDAEIADFLEFLALAGGASFFWLSLAAP